MRTCIHGSTLETPCTACGLIRIEYDPKKGPEQFSQKKRIASQAKEPTARSKETKGSTGRKEPRSVGPAQVIPIDSAARSEAKGAKLRRTGKGTPRSAKQKRSVGPSEMSASAERPAGLDQPDGSTITEQVLFGANIDRMSEEGLTDSIHGDGVMQGLFGDWED